MTRIYWTDARTGGATWWVTITRCGRVIGRGPLISIGRDDAGAPTVTYQCEDSGELRTVAYGGGQ